MAERGKRTFEVQKEEQGEFCELPEAGGAGRWLGNRWDRRPGGQWKRIQRGHSEVFGMNSFYF